jgi:hypothetical protein
MSEIPPTPPTEPLPSFSTPPADRSWAGIVSLICGAAALPGGCCCCLVGWPLAIAGIVFGILGLKSKQDMLAKVGIGLSAFALLVPVVMWILSAAFNIAIPYTHPNWR